MKLENVIQLGDIADICHNRHNRRRCTLSSQCLFGTENWKFWPIWAILLRIGALFGVILSD